MRRELPVRPNLEHLKAQAKDLLEAFQRKERTALERVRASLPGAHGTHEDELAGLQLALHDAQSVIAREYGFASWAELRAHLEARLTPETLRALMQPHLGSPAPAEVEAALLRAAAEAPPNIGSLPPSLPMLPVRNALLAMGASAPLNVGRPSSVAAVEAARDGAGVLALFAQREDANEAPTEADLHPVGCAVFLTAVVPGAQGSGLWIVVRAVRWIRLAAIERREPYLVARVTTFEVYERETEQVHELTRALRERLQPIIAKLPDPEQLLQRVSAMTALQLADAAIANLPCSVADKARYASESDLAARLACVLALIERAA